MKHSFTYARHRAPAVVFLDELDRLVSKEDKHTESTATALQVDAAAAGSYGFLVAEMQSSASDSALG